MHTPPYTMQDFEKEYTLFQKALNIQDPWYVDDYKLVESSGQFHIFLDFKRGAKKHEKGILRWFTSRMTNALLEGINSLVQASKRKARGYRSTKNFIAMIYATANKFMLTVKPHA